MYEVAVEWEEKHDDWLHAQVGTHDPDTVNQEVNSIGRTVYKLEKTFNEVPAATEIVLAVRV